MRWRGGWRSNNFQDLRSEGSGWRRDGLGSRGEMLVGGRSGRVGGGRKGALV